MSRLDVAAYYPSLDPVPFRRNFSSWSCDPDATELIAHLVERWQTQGITGLPIGPEGFGVVGNAYLLPLDVRLVAEAVHYLRWMDDLYLFGDDVASNIAVSEHIDEELRLLLLERSVAKTRHYEDAAEAMKEIRDGMLASLSEVLYREDDRPSSLLHRRFHEFIVETENIDPRHFRYFFKVFTNRADTYAAIWLSENPAAMQIDPRIAADYLKEVALSIPQVAADVFALLASTTAATADILDARDLHLLRFAGGRVWGREEGEILWKIALDQRRRGPVRAWALMAASRTPAFRPRDVLELTLEEDDFYFRRACIASLRRVVEDLRGRRFLRHVRQFAPDLWTCSLWIDEPSTENGP